MLRLLVMGVALGAMLGAAPVAAQRLDADPKDLEDFLEDQLRVPYYDIVDGVFRRSQRPLVDRIPMRQVTHSAAGSLVDVRYAAATGQILTTADGMALYATKLDRIYGQSSIEGQQLESWRPYVVPENLRTGGFWGKAWNATLQEWVLTFAEKPLYTYAGDAAPGQANGVGGPWYTMEVF